jgi:hypothetical protein
MSERLPSGNLMRYMPVYFESGSTVTRGLRPLPWQRSSRRSVVWRHISRLRPTMALRLSDRRCRRVRASFVPFGTNPTEVIGDGGVIDAGVADRKFGRRITMDTVS